MDRPNHTYRQASSYKGVLNSPRRTYVQEVRSTSDQQLVMEIIVNILNSHPCGRFSSEVFKWDKISNHLFITTLNSHCLAVAYALA